MESANGLVLDWCMLITLVLQVVITVLLPFLLKKLIDWLNINIKTLNSRKDLVELETAVKIIRESKIFDNCFCGGSFDGNRL